MLLIGVEMLHGDGIKLKSASSFVVGLVLMGLVSVVVVVPRQETALDGRARIASLIMTCMVMLLLAKSTAWWTTTRGLQNLLAESHADCITISASEPFGLQWPWMSIIGDWTTPMNALAFRPSLLWRGHRTRNVTPGVVCA